MTPVSTVHRNCTSRSVQKFEGRSLAVTSTASVCIPVFWFLQHCTEVGEKSVGIVMMVSNVSVAVAAGLAAVFVIRRFQREFPVSSS